MIDSLIQYLLEEIAMDGDEGEQSRILSSLSGQVRVGRGASNWSTSKLLSQNTVVSCIGSDKEQSRIKLENRKGWTHLNAI